jgi:hypothetical protein
MLLPGAMSLLQALHEAHRPRKDLFYQRTTQYRSQLFTSIKKSRNRLLDDIFVRVGDARVESESLIQLRTGIYDYFDRSDWTFVDLIALAACTSVPPEQVADLVAPNALVYHSLRMLDDVLDGHHDYKGGERTLFGVLSDDAGKSHLASAGNLIPAMIVMATASVRLPAEERQLIERTLIGMLHESFPGDWNTAESYRQIALAKMGAYGMFLYRPVLLLFNAPDRAELDAFLVRSFFVSQLVNDLQDQEDDEARQQPNFWRMGREPEAAWGELVGEIEAMDRSCAEVPGQAREYVHTRMTDLIGYLLQVLRKRDQSRRDRTVSTS